MAEIYLATLGYAPDAEGLNYWVNNIQTLSEWTPETVAQSFFDQPLVKDAYPDELGYGPLVLALYRNIFDREADSEGYNYWLQELEEGRLLRNQMIIALINGGWANPAAATDMARFGNRIRASLVFVSLQEENGIVYSALSAVDQIFLRQAGRDVVKGIGSGAQDEQTSVDCATGALDHFIGVGTIYDDFSCAALSSARWLDLEERRTVVSGSLVMELAHVGDSGATQRNNRLYFANPDQIESIVASIMVEAVSVVDPIDGDGRAQVGVGSYWANDGTPGTGETGEVWGEVRLMQFVNGDLRADYLVTRCNDATCTGSTNLVVKTQFAPVEIGQTHELSIVRNGQQLIFRVDDVSEVVDLSQFVTVNPARQPFTQIRSRIDRVDTALENGHIRSRIGPVMVNGQLHDDFSSGTLDPDKWLTHELERGIVSAAVHSVLAGYGGQILNNNLRLRDPAAVRKLGAELTVHSMSNEGMEPRARLAGYWYDTGLPGDGATGEAYAEVAVIDVGGELRPRAVVFRCENADCTTGSLILNDQTSLGAAEVGVAYPVSIEWDGFQFVFTFGALSVLHQPAGLAAMTGPSQAPMRLIGTRLQGDSGWGEVHASFDDVFVGSVD